jgi:hypothetical protein
MLGRLVALKGWPLIGAELLLFLLAAVIAHGIFQLVEWLATTGTTPDSRAQMPPPADRSQDGPAKVDREPASATSDKSKTTQGDFPENSRVRISRERRRSGQ